MTSAHPPTGPFGSAAADVAEAARRVELLATAAQVLADRVRVQANAVTTAVDVDWHGPAATAARTMADLEVSHVLRCAANVEDLADALRRHGRAAADHALTVQMLAHDIEGFAGAAEMAAGGAW